MIGSSPDKEMQLSQRIAKIREKNSVLEKRYQEIEHDKKSAEEVGLVIERSQNRQVVLNPTGDYHYKSKRSTSAKKRGGTAQKHYKFQSQQADIRESQVHPKSGGRTSKPPSIKPKPPYYGGGAYETNQSQPQWEQHYGGPHGTAAPFESASAGPRHGRSVRDQPGKKDRGRHNGTGPTASQWKPPLNKQAERGNNPHMVSGSSRRTVRFNEGGRRQAYQQQPSQAKGSMCSASSMPALEHIGGNGKKSPITNCVDKLSEKFSRLGRRNFQNGQHYNGSFNAKHTSQLRRPQQEFTSQGRIKFVPDQVNGGTRSGANGAVGRPRHFPPVKAPNSQQRNAAWPPYPLSQAADGRWIRGHLITPDGKAPPLVATVQAPPICVGLQTDNLYIIPAMDEYIDDNLLDDLEQYTLKIDMDGGFIVYDPCLSDPILQKPLGPWLEDCSDTDSNSGGKLNSIDGSTQPTHSASNDHAGSGSTSAGPLSPGTPSSTQLDSLNAKSSGVWQDALTNSSTSSSGVSTVSSHLSTGCVPLERNNVTPPRWTSCEQLIFRTKVSDDDDNISVKTAPGVLG